MRRESRRYATRGLMAVLLLPLASIQPGCSKEKPAPPPQVADVTVLAIQPRDAPVVYEFVGQTQSSREVEIRARVDGFLERRVYTEGNLVKAGETLFVMDQKPFQASLQQARGELAQQQARLQVAEANLARVRPLAEQNAVSKKDLDDAVGNEKSARAAVLTAEGAVRQAELNLSYTLIQSPLTGLSSFAKVQEGAYVNPSNNLLTTVAQLDPMWVNFSISENEHLRFRESVGKGELKAPGGDGFLVEVILADGTVFQNRGRISFADPSFSKETGTFLVRATFSNAGGTLRPGQFVRVHVRGVTRPNAIVVPQRAVQQGAKSHFVWVVGKDGKAEQRALIVGEWLGDDWVITEGLKAGEQVVVDGAIRVAPGATLKVSQYKAPQEGTPAATRDAAGPTSVEKAASSRKDRPPAAPAPAAKDKAPQAPPGKGATGPASIRFAFRSADLDDAGRRAVAEIARAVTGTEDAIEVTGYADGRGSPERNRRFAEERAKAVRDALVAGGVAPGRIDLRRPAEVVGSGSSDEARRVDIVVSARPGRT
jgi:membrane fusion protein (multidrug efflux system)